MKDKYLDAFMKMTEVFAQTSEAKRLKVGSCLIKGDNPIAFGVNGTPPGWPSNGCEDENGQTLPHVLHSEIQCLNKLRKINETAAGGTLLITHGCCFPCSCAIIDAGIKKVVYKDEYRDSTGLDNLRQHGIEVIKWNS